MRRISLDLPLFQKEKKETTGITFNPVTELWDLWFKGTLITSGELDMLYNKLYVLLDIVKGETQNDKNSFPCYPEHDKQHYGEDTRDPYSY